MSGSSFFDDGHVGPAFPGNTLRGVYSVAFSVPGVEWVRVIERGAVSPFPRVTVVILGDSRDLARWRGLVDAVGEALEQIRPAGVAYAVVRASAAQRLWLRCVVLPILRRLGGQVRL